MKSENLYNILSEDQLDLLEMATEGQTVEKDKLPQIRYKLRKFSRARMLWEINQMKDELEGVPIKQVSMSAEGRENFDAVYRYINSFEADEETRKQNLIETAYIENMNIQQEIYRRIELGTETIEEIEDDINNIKNNLTTNLGVQFGFTYEEVNKIVKHKFNFDNIGKEMEKVKEDNEIAKSINISASYELNEELWKMMEELFG